METSVFMPLKTLTLEVLPPVDAPKTRLLSISDSPADHKALHRALDHKQWQLITAHTCRSAIRRLSKGVDAVFTESSLPDGTWKDILNHTMLFANPPQLVVTSRLADAYLWSEVLNLGGFDVLAKPLDEKEIRQVLDAIVRYHVRGRLRVRTAGTP
jgi:DNA-binding response OmpR family regulator